MFEKGVALRDHANFARLDRAIEAVHGYPARGRRIQPRDNPEQAGFAAAGRTEEPHHLSLYPARYDNVAHLPVDVLEHGAAIILETYVVDLQQSFPEFVRGLSIFSRSSVGPASGQNGFLVRPTP